jgi:hypothetical protein
MVGGINRFAKYVHDGTFPTESMGTSRAEISFFGRLPTVTEVQDSFTERSVIVDECLKHCYDATLDTYWM